jgi:single-strand DNA-binding protein
MANINEVSIVGNITRDPELRFTATGLAVTNFSIASNRRWQNKQTQQWEEEVSYFDVTAWGTLGQNIAESLAKGTRVIVVGRLRQRSWETDEGDKRSKIEITADIVGPSMEWATVEVTKNEKADSGQADSGRQVYANEETF